MLLSRKSIKLMNAEMYDAENKKHDIAGRTENVTRNLLAYLDASVFNLFFPISLVFYNNKSSGDLWISEQVVFCPDVLQTQVFKPAVQV